MLLNDDLVLPAVICTLEYRMPFVSNKSSFFFIGKTEFQLKAITPLLITAKQLVFVFCKARRLAIMPKTHFNANIYIRPNIQKRKNVHFLLPLSIYK